MGQSWLRFTSNPMQTISSMNTYFLTWDPYYKVTEHEGHRLKSVMQLKWKRLVKFIGNWIKDGHIQGLSTEPDILSRFAKKKKKKHRDTVLLKAKNMVEFP